MQSFTFHFNVKLPRELRNAINEKQNLSITKESKLERCNKTYPAWDRICVILDRIEDTIDYINSMELGHCKNRSAFDFFEFISCSAVVIDCIRHIGNIFYINSDLVKNIENTQDVFGSDYGICGTDKDFFEYIRSLCAMHPTNTNRQPAYLDDALFHCCPYVSWNHIVRLHSDGDLTATVYTSNHNCNYLHIPLYIKQFEMYLNKWIDHIENVVEAIHKYNDKIYTIFKELPVKHLAEYDNISEYLLYLKYEYSYRLGHDEDYVFDDYIKIFQITLTNPSNQLLLEKYKNAIIYSLEFLRNSLQNMQINSFENNGIKHPDSTIETCLFFELSHIFNPESAFNDFSYHLEKLYYLQPNGSHDVFRKEFARNLLEKVKPVINQYVYFDNTESDEEVIILIHLAQYLDALNSKNLLNRNIPNDEKYRVKILSNEKLEGLFSEDTHSSNMADGIDFEIVPDISENT